MKKIADVATAVGFVVACFAVVGLGQLLIDSAPGEWYRNLERPSFSPPNWVFGPVWTALYISMGIAAWLVWRRRRDVAVALPLTLFCVQLTLNALWPVLFFGLHRPGLAFVEIIALWVAIALTLWRFLKVSKAAGLLLAPYLGWVSFATVLNGAFWSLNA